MGSLGDVKGKNFLVTGGASGLGALYTEEFLKEGAKVSHVIPYYLYCDLVVLLNFKSSKSLLSCVSTGRDILRNMVRGGCLDDKSKEKNTFPYARVFEFKI